MPFDEDWLKLPGDLRPDRQATRNQHAAGNRRYPQPRNQTAGSAWGTLVGSLSQQAYSLLKPAPGNSAKAGSSWTTWVLILAVIWIGSRMIGRTSSIPTQDLPVQVQDAGAATAARIDQPDALVSDTFADQIDLFVKRQLEALEKP